KRGNGEQLKKDAFGNVFASRPREYSETTQPPIYLMPTLHFKGKPLVQNHHLVVPFSELEAVKSRGVSPAGAGPSLHDNLIIEGDNLKALKALLPVYHGKVKCIYIDPPYNTGNEKWIY